MVCPSAKEAAILKIGISSMIFGIMLFGTFIPSNCEDFTIMSPQSSLQVFVLLSISIFAFIFNKTSNKPDLVLFNPTFLIITSEFLEIKAATIINAADEKSPTTSYEEILDNFEFFRNIVLPSDDFETSIDPPKYSIIFSV